MEKEIRAFAIEAALFDESILKDPDMLIVSRSVEMLCGNCRTGEDISTLQRMSLTLVTGSRCPIWPEPGNSRQCLGRGYPFRSAKFGGTRLTSGIV